MLRFPAFASVLPVLARPLGLVPHALQRGVLEAALARLFGATVRAGDLGFLDGRCLAVEIEDAGWRWPITVRHGRLAVLERDHPADAAIRGQTAAFLVMAGRLEDPDTLFFQRRLVIEGDTELGLWLKNFLDAVEEEQFPQPLRYALKGMREAYARLGPISNPR
jgi:O2-independent ubiquinone biosynthesis accessory factor UbiT